MLRFYKSLPENLTVVIHYRKSGDGSVEKLIGRTVYPTGNPRRWGTHLDNTPVVVHNGNHYLVIELQSKNDAPEDGPRDLKINSIISTTVFPEANVIVPNDVLPEPIRDRCVVINNKQGGIDTAVGPISSLEAEQLCGEVMRTSDAASAINVHMCSLDEALVGTEADAE